MFEIRDPIMQLLLPYLILLIGCIIFLVICSLLSKTWLWAILFISEIAILAVMIHKMVYDGDFVTFYAMHVFAVLLLISWIIRLWKE